MKVCVFNAKGGVGRTTLTLNLAGHFAQAHPGHRILVQDRDPQGSALAWAVTPFTVGRSHSWRFDIELIDRANRDRHRIAEASKDRHRRGIDCLGYSG